MSFLGQVWRCSLAATLLATAEPAQATDTEHPKAQAGGSGGLRGIDLDGLSESERGSFFRLVRKYASACGKAESLETSLRSDERCRRSVFAGRYIVRLLKAGLLESEVEE